MSGIGNILGGIGQIIGGGAGLASVFQQTKGFNLTPEAQWWALKKQRQWQNQDKAQTQQNFERVMTQTVQDRVADAQAAGISPLAALGISGVAGPASFGGGVAIPGVSSSGRRGGLAQGLGGLADIASGFSDIALAREEQKLKLEKAMTDQVNEGIRMSRFQNDAVVASSVNTLLNSFDPKKPSVGFIPNDEQMGIRQLYHPWRDRRGNLQWIMDEKAAEGLEIGAPLGMSIMETTRAKVQEALDELNIRIRRWKNERCD